MIRRIKIKKGKIIDWLESLKPEIDKTIEKYFPGKATEKWLEFVFGKPEYSFHLEAVKEALTKPVWDFLSRGGKRWRPLLFLLITRAVGGNVKKVKDFLIIPELIHNGSLIVDDIEDQSETRRGKPCLHRIFGIDVAINAGNFLYFLPFLVLIKNKEKFRAAVLLKTYQACIQEMINLHFGQAMDIFWHRGKTEKINEAQYFQMSAFKTGCLPRMTAKLAVLLSGGKNELAEKMGRVAEAIGIAFQIQDDILNLTGKEFAKKKGGLGEDITEGKRSLIVIHTLRQAKKNDRERLIKILNAHTKNQRIRNEAIAIIKKYGSIKYAREKAKKLIKEAWEKADIFLAESAAKKKLKEFVNYLVERKI